MKDVYKTRYNDKDYRIVFNLNVMEEIQEEYGTLEEWGKLTDGKEKEVNVRALVFGFKSMLNEGIDIDNEQNGTNNPMLTEKQVGRIVTEVGMDIAINKLNETVIESTQSGEESKNV